MLGFYERLQEINCASVSRFSFDGIDTFARVCNIHDPDTITVVFIWSDQPIKLNVRLDKIDAPELKSKIPAEAEVCRKGTKILQQLIGDKVVRITLGKYDKFGRVLSTVYSLQPIEDDLNYVNDYLLKYHYVRSYDGGKKLPWSKEELDTAGIKK